MDIEFHYYMTYLIAAKAGFSPDEALTLAHASQHVDDNTWKFEIDKGKASAYRNYISQTIDILKPKARLLRIYLVFHFVPGDPGAEGARRKDGAMHRLVTTPDSENAQWLFDTALATGDLYRIGIAAHAYADSWAHQNFIGYFDAFNAMKGGPLERVSPNIGHADARHHPDWPALVWKDSRLSRQQVDNKQRFLEAARAMFIRLSRCVDRFIDGTTLGKRADELVQDLSLCIGEQDPSNKLRDERIARYREFASLPAYGGRMLLPYDEDAWFVDAVGEKVRGLRDRSDLTHWDPVPDLYTWKDPQGYTRSPWYRFQEAVKAHQAEALAQLKRTSLQGLELPEL
jgi:hypothetical protein